MTLRTPRAMARLLKPDAMRRPHGLSSGFALAVLLAFGTADQAGATTIGTVGSSVWLFAALVALPLVNELPRLLTGALPTAGVVLLIGAGATWLWRAWAAQRAAPFPMQVRRNARPTDSTIEQQRQSPCAVRPSGVILLPPGLSAAELLGELRLHFMQLQSAWNADDQPMLRGLTLPGMLDELCLSRRASIDGAGTTHTEVLMLEAELLDCEELAGAVVVSVDFSGLMREAANQEAAPFRELWMLVKFKPDGVGWKLARHQALL